MKYIDFYELVYGMKSKAENEFERLSGRGATMKESICDAGSASIRKKTYKEILDAAKTLHLAGVFDIEAMGTWINSMKYERTARKAVEELRDKIMQREKN